MAIDNRVKNIAIVGASGNVGASVLAQLLEANHFTITIISRLESQAQFPSHPSITVKKGSYDDMTFLASAFKDQEAAIFAFGFMGMAEQSKVIVGAAKAGVKWLIPTEYAADGMNQEMMDQVPMFHPKVQARQQIEDLAKTHNGLKWIGVATNPWTEFSIQMGMFGLDPWERTAKLVTDGGHFNTSTIDQVGRGIARLLSLPITNSEDPRRSLSHYANRFVYISSLHVSQQELFEAMQRVTETTESDWKIETTTTKLKIQNAHRIAAGEDHHAAMLANADLTFAFYMGEGLGGDYEDKAADDRKVLGLQKGNLDKIVERVINKGRMPKW